MSLNLRKPGTDGHHGRGSVRRYRDSERVPGNWVARFGVPLKLPITQRRTQKGHSTVGSSQVMRLYVLELLDRMAYQKASSLTHLTL